MKLIKKPRKVLIPIKVKTFELTLFYLIYVQSINRKFVSNIIELIDIIDTKPYEDDDYNMFLINAIRYVANLRNNGVRNVNYIKTYIEQSDLDQSYVANIYETLKLYADDLTKEEYETLIVIISNYLDYSCIYEYKDKIQASLDKLTLNDGTSSAAEYDNFKELISTLDAKMKNIDAAKNVENSILLGRKNDKQLMIEVSNMYDNLNDPSNTFIVGLKELNRFLNGGYKRKKFYMYYAPTNSFKSGILLYNCLWILQFNPHIKPKFPNKHLAILLLSMENSVEETMERIFSIYTSGSIEPKNISKEVFLNYWKEIISNLESRGIYFFIEYMKPGITTSDIIAFADKKEQCENVEIVSVVIDHLGNIGKLDKTVDDRTGLINSAYALSNWAKQSDRLVISAMHTNSTFDDTLADAIQNGRHNLVRMMGRHCIADAKYIDRVTDQSIYILKERSIYDNEWYLGFKYEKMRGRKSQGSNVFYHKMENEITLRFDEGINACFSYESIPGGENSIQNSQMQIHNSSMNRYNNIPIQTMPNTVFRNMQPQQQQPINVEFNNNTEFDINSIGNFQNVTSDNTINNNVSEMNFNENADELIEDVYLGLDDGSENFDNAVYDDNLDNIDQDQTDDEDVKNG